MELSYVHIQLKQEQQWLLFSFGVMDKENSKSDFSAYN